MPIGRYFNPAAKLAADLPTRPPNAHAWPLPQSHSFIGLPIGRIKEKMNFMRSL